MYFLHFSSFVSFLSLLFARSLSISHYLNFFYLFYIYLFLKSKKMIFVVCLFVCLFLYLKKREREWRCETWESDNGILRFLPSFPLFLSLSLYLKCLYYRITFCCLGLSFSLYHCYYLFFSLFRFKFDFSLLTYLSRTQKI